MFENKPVTPERLEGARRFAATYAGEHVAGTEFVIGALFVSWGVSTVDVLLGLLLGNFIAVLTWGLITGPIAFQTRLTLYAYLERIAGVGMIRIYNVVNAVLFAILGGAMITVSASAVRLFFDIPPQVNWYPEHAGFVVIALSVGALVSFIAAKGFRSVARFAEVCAPWMIVMFVVGALAVLPQLINASSRPSIDSLSNFITLADEMIWEDRDADIGFWHVAAFAWVANLAMHGSLGDMSLLRFARRPSYGFFSALGMFLGHYLAWVCAGIMGAGVALLLQRPIEQLDAGEVAFQSLGLAGILAVVIAGWTTSNPTIYRAGLAIQALNPNWSRSRVTFLVGAATTVTACFPFVFTQLLGFVGIMGLMLAPVGAVVVAEHWLLPRLGMTRYWSHYKGQNTNLAAVITWVLGLLFAGFLWKYVGLHLFFLLIPVWVVSTIAYLGLARLMGASETFAASKRFESNETLRRQREADFLRDQTHSTSPHGERRRARQIEWLTSITASVALLSCIVLATRTYSGGSFDFFKTWLIAPTILYFLAALFWTFDVTRQTRSETNE